AVWAGSRIEKRMRAFIPSLVRSFLTPFFTVLISVPLAFLVIGPVASWASDLIGVAFTALQTFSPLLFGAILGVAWQLLVIFGLHWGIIPIMYVLLAEQGSNPISPVAMVSTFGVLGVVLALMIKSKEKTCPRYRYSRFYFVTFRYF
uniref:PTS transporter subunit EIIC n=1 Tax=Jeotgalibaca porci TaxID=1868793 RepID=UPI00359FCDDF